MRKRHPFNFIQTQLILLAAATAIMKSAYQLTAGSISIASCSEHR
jgi:hypothetical protein